MSIAAVKWAFDQDGLKASTKFVLVALAEAADHSTQECFWGQESLARRTGLTPRTVWSALKELDERNLIVRRHRGRRGATGGRTSDLYRLALPTRNDCDLKPQPTRNGRGLAPADQLATGADQLATGADQLATIAREPIREPSVEPSDSGRATRDPAARDDASRTSGTRGTRLAEDWMPSLDDIAWQREQGIDDELARYETENFKDYWVAKAGADARKVSWSRTWKKWMRTAAERANMPRSTGAPQPVGSGWRPRGE